MRAVQRELQRHASSCGPQAPKPLGAYLHAANPPPLCSLTDAIPMIVRQPVHSTAAETTGIGDPVVRDLVQIVRSRASCAIQTEQLRALRPRLKPYHLRVVSDLGLILGKTVNCRRQLEAVDALRRQLQPPTKGTPEFALQQSRSMLDFQRALWAPPQNLELVPPAKAPQHRSSSDSWSPSDQEELWTARFNGESWKQVALRFPTRPDGAFKYQMLALDTNRSAPSSKKPTMSWQDRKALLQRRGTAATPAEHRMTSAAPPAGSKQLRLHPPAPSTQHPPQPQQVMPSVGGKRSVGPTGQAGAPAQRQRTSTPHDPAAPS